MSCRSGIGMDVHPLVEGRALILGGVTVPHSRGLEGHSDGDVLIHAVIDALFGAAGMGDIGTHFPSSDPHLEGASSAVLLGETVEMIGARGWQVSYVDATIVAEKPVLSPFIGQIKERLASAMRADPGMVNIKAKSTDGLGFVGRGEGIAALAISTVQKLE